MPQCSSGSSLACHEEGAPIVPFVPIAATRLWSCSCPVVSIEEPTAAGRMGHTARVHKLGIKTGLPKCYKGEPNPTLFKNWLSLLLGFSRNHQLESETKARIAHAWKSSVKLSKIRLTPTLESVWGASLSVVSIGAFVRLSWTFRIAIFRGTPHPQLPKI
jgi:hypothetical protein